MYQFRKISVCLAMLMAISTSAYGGITDSSIVGDNSKDSSFVGRNSAMLVSNYGDFKPMSSKIEEGVMGGSVPVGTVVIWTVAGNPEGWAEGEWLECDGNLIPVHEDYNELRAVLGKILHQILLIDI